MEEEKIITLDLTGCTSLGEWHQRIRKAFDFPEWYGENWDAFWDLLQTECDADKVEILGEHTLPKEFMPELEQMHEVLQRNIEDCKLYGWNFDFEIIS